MEEAAKQPAGAGTSSPFVIRLPDEMPVTEAEAVPTDEQPRTPQQITANELRLASELTDAPRPDAALERAPMLKPTIVAPIDVNATVLKDCLDALSLVARQDATLPIARHVRLTYSGDRLRLEATDQKVWAIADINKVHGGRDGFECVVPLRRARGVLARHRPTATIPLGIDENNIHLGNYSFPHGGMLRDFPPRPLLLPDELKALVPASYIDAIMDKLIPIVDENRSEAMTGVHIDFNDGVAVSTDGHRLHLLRLRQMQIASRDTLRVRPSVALTARAFRFLRAVAERDWVRLLVSEKLVSALGEDYVMMARPIEESLRWRQLLPKHQLGSWVDDRAHLVHVLDEVSRVATDNLKLSVDIIGEKLLVNASADSGESYRASMTARRNGGPPALRVAVNPRYLQDAVSALDGGLVCVGFDQEQPEIRPITIRGESDEFLAIVMPMAPAEE